MITGGTTEQQWQLHKKILEFSQSIQQEDEITFNMLNMIAATVINKQRKSRLLRVMVLEAEQFLKIMEQEEKQSFLN